VSHFAVADGHGGRTVAEEEPLADDPPNDPIKDVAEIEIICPRCGYRMMRTAARLRRPHHIACPACGEVIVPGTDVPGTDPTR